MPPNGSHHHDGFDLPALVRTGAAAVGLDARVAEVRRLFEDTLADWPVTAGGVQA
jgi:hypothetical protein